MLSCSPQWAGQTTGLLKTLYWNLYTPYENVQAEQELDGCRKQLIDVPG